jgi:dihydrofolate reductase
MATIKQNFIFNFTRGQQNNLIGKDNDLPWKLPADLKYFKQKTLNKPIVMGRKTCESLPFALPNRKNIVITRNINFDRQNFEIINKIDQLKDLDCEIMVIGGAMIYQLLMPLASKLLITRIHHQFEGDTYFHWQPNNWQLTNEIYNKADDKNHHDYSFLEYKPK